MAKKFEDGVKFYTRTYAVVEVNFPEDDVCCEHCQMYSFGSRRCQIDKNIVPAYPSRNVGAGCPLIRKDEQ